MPNQPIAFVGNSNSGKTSLICGLIPILLARNETVAVLKHTHHDVNLEARGDTERFLAAGATEAVLADDFKAAHFGPMGPSEWAYSHPTDLLRLVRSQVILAEGFKAFASWPKVVLAPWDSLLALGSVRNVVALVGNDRGETGDTPRFGPGQLLELLDFLDRITVP